MKATTAITNWFLADGDAAKKQKRQRAGYVAFAGLVFSLSLYATFPFDAIGQRIAQEVSRATGGQVTLSFRKMSSYWFTGIEFDDAVIRQVRPGNEPLELAFDNLRARLKILPLFTLNLAGSIEGRMGDSRIAVDARDMGTEGIGLEVAIEQLNLVNPPVLPKLAGFPISGVIDGGFEGVWSNAAVIQSAGAMKLQLREVIAGPTEVRGIKLPATRLGVIDLEFVLDKGRLRLAEFKQNDAKDGPPDLMLEKPQASVTLRDSMRTSSYDVCLQMKLSDDYMKKNASIGGAMQLATVQFKKDGDGFLHVPLLGSFGGLPRPGNSFCRNRGMK